MEYEYASIYMNGIYIYMNGYINASYSIIYVYIYILWRNDPSPEGANGLFLARVA